MEDRVGHVMAGRVHSMDVMGGALMEDVVGHDGVTGWGMEEG